MVDTVSSSHEDRRLTSENHASVSVFDGFSRALAIVGILGVLSIAGIMFFEVISRNVFDSPTPWSVEVVTYLVVATAFLPLAAVQLDSAHIRVEILDGLLSSKSKFFLRSFSLWTGFFIVTMMSWQFAIQLIGDYNSGMRDWGLLRVPLWIPETPVFFGLFGFALAMLSDAIRQRPDQSRIRITIALLLVAVLAVFLWTLGKRPVLILDREADLGTIAILGTTALAACLISGVRFGVIWVGTLVVAALLAFYFASLGLTSVGVFIGVAILVFLLSGMPVSIAIAAIALLGLYFMLPVPQLTLLAERPWRSLNSYTYSAIPMFVLMGSILIRSGVSASFFGGIAAWLSRVPGGLAHASLASSGLFAAVSGSSLATAATVGQVSGPEMMNRGYSKRLALGSIAGGGTLGILIPPSVPMIVYGATVGASVTTLFAAAMLPGLMVLASMMIMVFIWSKLVPTAAPKEVEASSEDILSSLKSIAPFLALIAAVLGSIYTGIVTPTEAGALGVIASLVLSAAYRRLSLRMLYEAATEAAKLSAGILFIVVATSILTWVLDYAHIPQTIVGGVEALGLPTWLLLALIALFYVFLGMFIDPISMMLMTISITLPIVVLAGYDPIWFGVALMIMVEVGLITPPVGIILFVLRGLFPEIPLREVILGALPFAALLILNVAILAMFPGIVSFLPELLKD